MAKLTLWEKKAGGRGRESKKDPCEVTYPDAEFLDTLSAEQKNRVWYLLNKQVSERVYSRSIAGYESSNELLAQAKAMAEGAGIELSEEQLKNAARKLGLRFDPPKIVVFELPTSLEVQLEQVEDFLKEPEVETPEENASEETAQSEQTSENEPGQETTEESADEGGRRRKKR